MIKFIKLSLFLISGVVMAQENHETINAKYKVVYDFQFKPDSLNSDFVKNEKTFLYKDDLVSVFISEGKFKQDSLISSVKETDNAVSLLSGLTLGNYSSKVNFKIIKNYPEEGIITHNEKVYKTSYYFEERLDLNWRMINEQDSIAGIPVKKAEVSLGDRDFVAYYAPSIPINDGPYKFSGLPGLILKLYDKEEKFVFTFESIEEVDTSVLVYFYSLTPKILTTKKELQRARTNDIENPEDLHKIQDTSMHKTIKDRLKKFNDHIEIY